MRERAVVEEEFFTFNVNATETLARSAAKAGVRRFIYLSSIKANGEKTVDRPIGPHDPATPEDAYGRSKLAAERALIAVAAATGLQVVIVRPPLVYGSCVGANFRRLLSLVDSGVPLPLGAVKNQRSMIAVWNLVSLLSHVSTHPQAPGRIWLASDGDDISTPRLIRTIAAALERRTHLIPVPVPVLRFVGLVSGRVAEVERLVDSLQVDISVTRQVLGWQPPMTVDEGIARTVAWFRGLDRAAV
jgi:nucleoside-diphosphate-sugar epimerase